MGTSVVGGCDGAEAFLASRIPLSLLSAFPQTLQHVPENPTICSFTVLPSSSIVRIFYVMLAYRKL